MSEAPSPDGPTAGAAVTGRQLAELGLWMPRRRPETAQLILVTRVDEDRRASEAGAGRRGADDDAVA